MRVDEGGHEVWQKLLDWFWALIILIMGLFWGAHERRMTLLRDRVNRLESLKADQEDLLHLRESVSLLFRGQKEVTEKLHQSSERTLSELHKVHVDLIDRITTISKQVNDK